MIRRPMRHDLGCTLRGVWHVLVRLSRLVVRVLVGAILVLWAGLVCAGEWVRDRYRNGRDRKGHTC